MWKATTQYGCGFAVRHNVTVSDGSRQSCKVFVCFFNPPGNYQDNTLVRNNVLPPI